MEMQHDFRTVMVLNIPANSFFEVALLVNLLVDHLNVSVKLHFRSCIT